MDIESLSEKEVIEQRKKSINEFLTKKKQWIYYLILSLIIFLGVYIRTLNISKLKDITTGTWTLGPDLDPFLFLRWAKEIVENGSLMTHDIMRYVPLGYDTAGEMKLLAYMIAWFHNILSFFPLTDNVTYSAIIFPVAMFALTTIAFFLFARKIFFKESDLIKNSIALIATLLFVLVPSLLPRTIAGIPEKESVAFFFMFMAFYFFISAFTSEKRNKSFILSVLAGISTGLMALVWGGVIFIFFTIPGAVFLSFILGKVGKKELICYGMWVFSSFAIMMPFSTRYTLWNLAISTSTGFGLGILIILLFSLLFYKDKKIEKLEEKTKIPREILLALIFSLIMLIVISIILGPGFILGQINEIQNNLIEPSSTRFSFTVAENKQPYFNNDWKDNFGPILYNIPIYFWLFFFGSVLLFFNMISALGKKEKLKLTIGYILFLICLIFSRYSASSIFNGVNGTSIVTYFAGWIILIYLSAETYYKNFKKEKLEVFKKFNFAYILYFIILTLGIIGARGGIRLIMVLGSISPIAVSFLIVKTINKSFKEKKESSEEAKNEDSKILMKFIAVVFILLSAFIVYNYYILDKSNAENFAPGAYQWQWQEAMSWVRSNTSQNAVFAHWWDYGYWVQSIGERATILDGGNAIVYWDYLMGRYVLTEPDDSKTLEFLYTHNATHLLIDSTEIGKYTAFSSIGSDENYDRFSWISIFLLEEGKITETGNKTIYLYSGGSATDEDIVWKENNNEIFLPAKKTIVGGVILQLDQKGKFSQPQAAYFYQNKQYNIPLKYLYVEKDQKITTFDSGLEAGIFLFPKINVDADNKAGINYYGASLYLSRRTINSKIAQLYLFDKKTDSFKITHIESNQIINSLKGQGTDLKEFIYYSGFQGPIKIWEINYPSTIKANPEYLKTDYPNKSIEIAKPGEY
ncbi:MAG: STT3 domain-containing protein [Nanoarchaeota archaeon]